MLQQIFLFRGFVNGFAIPCMGLEKKHMLWMRYLWFWCQRLWKKSWERTGTQKETASTFRDTPLTHRRRFPQDTVPKKTPGEFRLVYHLSYPEGKRVNDYIDTLLCSVSFVPLDQVMQITRNSRLRIQSYGKQRERETHKYIPTATHRAAHILPETPWEISLATKGFRLEGNIYIDKGTHLGSVALH